MPDTPVRKLAALAEVLATVADSDNAIASMLVVVDAELDVPSRPLEDDSVHDEATRSARLGDVARELLLELEPVLDLERRRGAERPLNAVPFSRSLLQLVAAHLGEGESIAVSFAGDLVAATATLLRREKA
jgi:hypothetical protein